MKRSNLLPALACALSVLTAVPASATAYTVYASSAEFVAAAGPSLQLQDFSGFPADFPLAGHELLPGATMSTNAQGLRPFVGGVMPVLSGFGLDELWIDTHVPAGTNGFAFDIRGMDSGTGPGLVSVFFGPDVPGQERLDVLFYAPQTDSIDHFFGLVADTPITRVRWTFGTERDDTCCEEVVLDNLRLAAAVPVPEPGVGWLAGAGVAALLLRRRRTAAAC